MSDLLNNPDLLQKESGQLDNPFHYVKSRTPQQRREDHQQAQVERLQATTKGDNGIAVHKANVIRANHDPSDPSVNQGDLTVPGTISGCMNGVAAFARVPFLTPPQPA